MLQDCTTQMIHRGIGNENKVQGTMKTVLDKTTNNFSL
jgi:hypothetical protein